MSQLLVKRQFSESDTGNSEADLEAMYKEYELTYASTLRLSQRLILSKLSIMKKEEHIEKLRRAVEEMERENKQLKA